MFKSTSFVATLAVGTLVAFSASAEARSCRTLDRVEFRAARVVDGTTRIFRRTGDAVVRTGDRAFGWLFHRRDRV